LTSEKQKIKVMADIKMKLTIKAAPGKVYDAISTQEGIANWWCKNTIAKPEIGFMNVFTFGKIRNEFEVMDLKPGKRVEWKGINSIDEWIGTHVSFDLEEKEGNTILRFAHSDWKAMTETYAVCTYDWSRFITSLKSLCETGVGTPA
jgi:uncharacterized protein YndB with AHSA1/START domain